MPTLLVKYLSRSQRIVGEYIGKMYCVVFLVHLHASFSFSLFTKCYSVQCTYCYEVNITVVQTDTRRKSATFLLIFLRKMYVDVCKKSTFYPLILTKINAENLLSLEKMTGRKVRSNDRYVICMLKMLKTNDACICRVLGAP